MAEINSIQKKEGKLAKKKFISSKKPIKQKKFKGKKKLIDISNRITLEFKYEDFESETESFFPQIYREENQITINNVHLLDQSHLKFLINPNSDITNHYNSYKQKNFKNITWKDIELIYFYCSEKYSCPICLESKLVCPVITKCGHVFCYPCIISLYNYYTKYDENKTNNIPKCPFCKEKLEMNSINDCLKICKIIETVNYNIDMKVKFNLILRDKKSQTLYNLIYDPLLTNWENNFRYKMRDIPENNIKEFNFSRIFLANEKIVKNILNEYKLDLEELRKEFDSTSDELKKISINQCINKIDYFILNCKYEHKIKDNIQSNNSNLDKKDNKKIKVINDFNSNEDKDDTNINIDYKKYSLFYQEENGDIYYLAPLIMEILLYEYGDYNSLPTEIEGNILDISMNQVTPEFKSKYNYLNHLRIGSIIYFIEIDINNLISSSTKIKFREALNERNRMRNLLKNQEKKYELFLTKKYSKIFEEEKNFELNSTMGDSEKSIVPLFLFSNDEIEKNENEIEIKEKIDELNKDSKKENKLALLLLEKEDKEEKDLNKIFEKDGKNKNNRKKKQKDGKKGKKKIIKEKVFNSENCENFSESDY